jgi:hypothetical protein
MGLTKAKNKARGSQPRKSVARRARYRARMITLSLMHGPDATRIGRKLRRIARDGGGLS